MEQFISCAGCPVFWNRHIFTWTAGPHPVSCLHFLFCANVRQIRTFQHSAYWVRLSCVASWSSNGRQILTPSLHNHLRRVVHWKMKRSNMCWLSEIAKITIFVNLFISIIACIIGNVNSLVWQQIHSWALLLQRRRMCGPGVTLIALS